MVRVGTEDSNYTLATFVHSFPPAQRARCKYSYGLVSSISRTCATPVWYVVHRPGKVIPVRIRRPILSAAESFVPLLVFCSPGEAARRKGLLLFSGGAEPRPPKRGPWARCCCSAGAWVWARCSGSCLDNWAGQLMNCRLHNSAVSEVCRHAGRHPR